MVLNMPSKQLRKQYLYGIEEVQGVGIKRERRIVVIKKGVKHSRGQQAADDLYAMVIKVHKHRKLL